MRGVRKSRTCISDSANYIRTRALRLNHFHCIHSDWSGKEQKLKMSTDDIVPNHGEDDTEGVIMAKGVSMAVLFVASMICGIIPMILAKKLNWLDPKDASTLKTSNRVVMCLLSFGGGVLFSTTFMHLMPEVQHNVEYLQAVGRMREFDFELTPLLTCIGFFVMYFVEELVHLYIDYREKKHGGTAPLVRNLSIRRSGSHNVTNSTADLIDSDASNSKGIEAHGHSHTHGHSHMPIAVGGDDKVTSALRGLLIVLALSVHELFEGLAVGLESSTSHVWYMLGAISAHKLVIAFCIGVELLATKTKTWLAIIYITTFAIVSPLGIGIGILLVGGQGATAAGVYSVVLQGLASGTLLYVIFFEIWRNDRTGMLQFATAVVGFVIMFGLQLLTGHSHSHSHGDDDDHGHDHGHSHD